MKFDRRCFYLALPTVLLLVIGSAAQERRIEKSDLPPAVQRAADEQSKGATVRGYSTEIENGKREYELESMVNGRSRDVTIAPDGTVLEVEQQVEMGELPASVRDALQAQTGSGKITRIESLTKQGKLVAYEAQVRRAGKRSEIQVGPDGKSLPHPE
jgi:hypothetical protein